MTIPEMQNAGSRDVILRFLGGDTDLDKEPAMLDDDILLFAVRRVEAADPDWVLGQLSDRTWRADLRVAVMRMLRKHHVQGHAILSREIPGLRSR